MRWFPKSQGLSRKFDIQCEVEIVLNEDEIEEMHSKEHFYADFTSIQKIIKYIVYFLLFRSKIKI